MISNFFSRFNRLLHPLLPVGGLEISDAFLRFVSLTRKEPIFQSVRLTPGIISNGIIRDKPALLTALQTLRQQIGDAPTHVVVSLFSSELYTSLIRLPIVSLAQESEALDLNLRSHSPFPIAESYYSAELIERFPDHVDFLALFAARSVIDPLNEVLTAAGFTISAIESPARSLTRVFATLGEGYDFTRPYLLVFVSSGGLDFVLVFKGKLTLQAFHSWTSLHVTFDDREIDATVLEPAITAEAQRFLHYYAHNYSGTVTDVVLMTPQLFSFLENIFQNRLGLRVAQLVSRQFSDFDRSFIASLGAGLRGLIARSDDTMVSVAPLGASALIRVSEQRHFIAFWRYASISVVALLLAIFFIADIILFRISSTTQTSSPVLSVDAAAAATLQERAKYFNRLVDGVSSVLLTRVPVATLLRDVQAIAGNTIVFTRFSFQPLVGNLTISGHAPSALTAINFKNNLDRNTQFERVQLPLAEIATDPKGATFRVTMHVKR